MSKQETLEEFAKAEAIKFYKNGGSFTDLIILGAKWQEQKSDKKYSEDEVIAIIEKSRITGLTAEYLLLTEQFKKK